MNAESILTLSGELLVKSSVVLLAAHLTSRLWRGATAAQRHLVWLVALATVMMLPLTRLVAPFWKIPLAPAKKVTGVPAELPLTRMEPVTVDTLPAAAAAPASVPASRDWRELLLGAWLSGVVGLLVYRSFGSWRLQRLLRRSMPLEDPRIRLLLSRTLSELGLRRRPEIRLSEECRVPITWGSFRPAMLLPTSALKWNDTWLTAALRHEAAHIRRYDYLTRWFAHMACALYWPNPLVWLLARSLRVAQELAADDLVLRAGTPADEYASQLVDAARIITTHGFFVRQAVAMACPSTLEDRVRAIVDGRRDRRPLSRLAAACGSATLALTLVLSTAAQLRSDEQKPAPPSPAPGPADAVASHSKIEIEAKFVEMDGPVITKTNDPSIYTDPQFQVIFRTLHQTKGVNFLSHSRLSARPNHPTILSEVSVLRTPTEWERDGQNWRATKFGSKQVGTALAIEPRLKADGTIELRAVASVVQFLGFRDLDTGDSIPAAIPAPGETISIPPTIPGHRFQAVFSERKRELTVAVHSEETVAVPALEEAADVKPFEKTANRGYVLVFISARTVNAAPDVVVSVDKSGNIKLDGDPVRPDQLKTLLQHLQTGLPGYSVVLRGDAATPYKTMMDVLEIVQQAGVTNPALAWPQAQKDATVSGATAISSGEKAAGKADELIVKEWKIPADLIPAKPGTDGPERESARNWLISKGVKLEGVATAIFVPANNRLIVRNTLEQLALLDEIINAAVSGQAAAPATESNQKTPESPVLAKAEKIIIPKLEFREATLVEALEILRKKSIESDPDKTGVKIVLNAGAVSDARITVSLTNIPLIEALKYVTGLAELRFAATAEAIVIQPLEAEKVTFDGVAISTPADDGPAMAKARALVLPEVEVRGIGIAALVDYLRKKSVEADPERKGVDLVLKPGTKDSVNITLSLKEVPLIEALRYFAELSNLELHATPNSLILQSAAVAPGLPAKAPLPIETPQPKTP